MGTLVAKPTLFEIETRLAEALNAVDEHLERGEEIPTSLLRIAQEYSLAADAKRDSCAAFIRYCEREETQAEERIAHWQAVRRRRERAREWLMNQIALIMQSRNIKKLPGAEYGFTLVQNPPSLAVECPIESLPSEAVRVIPERYEPDKRVLKDMLKQGATIEGVRLVEGGYRLKVT